MARKFATRPSLLWGVTDPYEALSMDRAVFAFGTTVQHELDSINIKGKDPDGKKAARKRAQVLEKWVPQRGSAGKPQFKDPASRSL